MSNFEQRMAQAKAVARDLYGGDDFDEREAAYLAADIGMGEDPDTAEHREERIEELTGEIREYKQTAGDAILEIGKRLKEAKGLLPHGEWLPWLNEKVEFSERTAQNFMRLADAYANPKTLADLGASKALQLLALNPIERDEFLAEKHDVNGQEKTVEEMSSRELEKALKERDEALAAKEAAEEKSAGIQTKLDTALSVSNDLEKQRAAAVGKTKELQEKLKTARDKEKDAKAEAENARRELEELKNKPVDVAVAEPSEETLENLRREAEAEAEEKVRKANAALEEAKARAAAAEAEAEKARKQLELADKEITVFQVLFNDWQRVYNSMLEALERITDPEKAGKLRMAIHAAAERMAQ